MLCSFGAIAILWQSNWQSAEEEERQLPDRSNCNSHNGGRGRNEWVKRGWQGLNAPLEHWQNMFPSVVWPGWREMSGEKSVVFPANWGHLRPLFRNGSSSDFPQWIASNENVNAHTDLYFSDDDVVEDDDDDDDERKSGHGCKGKTVVTIAVFQRSILVLLHNDAAIYLRKLFGPSQRLCGELEQCQMQWARKKDEPSPPSTRRGKLCTDWLLALKCAWEICPGYMYVCTLCTLCNNTGTDTRSRSKWLLCLFIVPRFQGFPMARCVHFAFPDDVRSTLLCSQSTFCGIFQLVTFERCLFFVYVYS